MFQVIFEGVTENGYEGDISLDDISIHDGECTSHYNTVEVKPKVPGVSKSLQEQINRYRKLLRRRHRMRLNRERKEKLSSKETLENNYTSGGNSSSIEIAP